MDQGESEQLIANAVERGQQTLAQQVQEQAAIIVQLQAQLQDNNSDQQQHQQQIDHASGTGDVIMSQTKCKSAARTANITETSKT
jgi:hypothetical protein